MSSILNYLKNKHLIWQANQGATPVNVSSTGYRELDNALQGGFPEHGVVDIDSQPGIGELRLLLPNLLTRQKALGKLLVFIAPPMSVNSEMLADYGFRLDQVLMISPTSAKEALWSAEQCLKSGCCHSVLHWHQHIEIHQIKRLQMAAEQGSALHVMFRQQKTISLSLPVSLGMKLSPHPQGVKVNITKRKGGWPTDPFDLDMRHQWPALAIPCAPDNVVPFRHSKVG